MAGGIAGAEHHERRATDAQARAGRRSYVEPFGIQNAARAPARCADGDPLYSMYCQGRGREGGAGARHGAGTLHIQHCPNSRSAGTRPCCRVSLVSLVACAVPLVPRVVSLAFLVSLVYAKWDLSPSHAVRGGVPVLFQELQGTPWHVSQCYRARRSTLNGRGWTLAWWG